MPLATYKDLCIDALDATALGRFWAEALGLELGRLDNGNARLDGPTDRHSIWINTVPEPVTVKQRVHLDMYAASTDDVLALGATPFDVGRLRWDVLKDPEGGELCVFPREEVPAHRLFEVVVDARDAHGITEWWAQVFGATVQDSEKDEVFSWFDDAPGMPFELVFQEVPEPKTVKNRIHWDVTGEVGPLVEAGATVLREPGSEIDWWVLADPEGNEFCVFGEGG